MTDAWSLFAHVDQLIPLISCSSTSLADRNKAEGQAALELSTSVQGVKGSVSDNASIFDNTSALSTVSGTCSLCLD